jgi:predicted transcriptional regulator
MTLERVEVRLDADRKQKLNKIAEIRDESVSELVRQMIDRLYDEAMLEYRLELVRRMSEANVEEMPDPEELSRQMNNKYGDNLY